MVTVELALNKLRDDLPFPLAELRMRFNREFGTNVSRATAYAWFQRNSIPGYRLAQLLHLIEKHSGKRLNLWNYIEVKKKRGRGLVSERGKFLEGVE